MTILVSENIVGAAMDQLRRDHDVEFAPDLWQRPQDLQQRLATAQAWIVRNQTQVTAPLIRSAMAAESLPTTSTCLRQRLVAFPRFPPG